MKMSGWFKVLHSSTIFQSYRDDARVIMKGCVQLSRVYGCNTGGLRGLVVKSFDS